MKKLIITDNKGFRMTFENGLTASVQWGAGNYCDNRNNIDLLFSKESAQSNTAEVAVFGVDDEFIDISLFITDSNCSDDVVAGYLTPNQIVDFLAAVKNYKI